MIDLVPTIIVEVNEEKPPSRRGSLRFRGNDLIMLYTVYVEDGKMDLYSVIFCRYGR